MSINTLPTHKGSGLSKNLLFSVLGIIVLASAAYYAWQYYGSNAGTSSEAVVKTTATKYPGDLSVAALPDSVQEAARRITRELEIIRTLRPLDTKFFEDPRFGILKQTPIVIPDADPVEREFSLTPAGGAGRVK